MPRWRKLHTKTVDSFDFNDMPDDFTRLLWTLLPLGLDRCGRGIDNAAWVRSKIFPLREDVEASDVAAALDWYEEHGMIERYQHDGRGYFWIPTWHRYQGDTRREGESELPAPPHYTDPSNNEGRKNSSGATPEQLTSNSGVTHEQLRSNSGVTHEQLRSNSGATQEQVASSSGTDVEVDVDVDPEGDTQTAERNTPSPSDNSRSTPEQLTSNSGVTHEQLRSNSGATQEQVASSSGTDVDVEVDVDPEGDTQTAERPDGPDPRRMFAALASLCQIDTQTMTERQRGQLNQSEKKLRKSGAGPGDLRIFERWWYAHDWRGQKDEPPLPHQVREEWGKYKSWIMSREEEATNVKQQQKAAISAKLGS